MGRRLPPVFLSIVIPAYNEEARINWTLEQLVVVSSGSAFAALSEVSLSSVKAQETINAGLAEAGCSWTQGAGDCECQRNHGTTGW